MALDISVLATANELSRTMDVLEGRPDSQLRGLTPSVRSVDRIAFCPYLPECRKRGYAS